MEKSLQQQCIRTAIVADYDNEWSFSFIYNNFFCLFLFTDYIRMTKRIHKCSKNRTNIFKDKTNSDLEQKRDRNVVQRGKTNKNMKVEYVTV